MGRPFFLWPRRSGSGGHFNVTLVLIRYSSFSLPLLLDENGGSGWEPAQVDRHRQTHGHNNYVQKQVGTGKVAKEFSFLFGGGVIYRGSSMVTSLMGHILWTGRKIFTGDNIL